jgi:hypothetical protein
VLNDDRARLSENALNSAVYPLAGVKRSMTTPWWLTFWVVTVRVRPSGAALDTRQ